MTFLNKLFDNVMLLSIHLWRKPTNYKLKKVRTTAGSDLFYKSHFRGQRLQ